MGCSLAGASSLKLPEVAAKGKCDGSGSRGMMMLLGHHPLLPDNDQSHHLVGKTQQDGSGPTYLVEPKWLRPTMVMEDLSTSFPPVRCLALLGGLRPGIQC